MMRREDHDPFPTQDTAELAERKRPISEVVEDERRSDEVKRVIGEEVQRLVQIGDDERGGVKPALLGQPRGRRAIMPGRSYRAFQALSSSSREYSSAIASYAWS
jgi:hypothetical protein